MSNQPIYMTVLEKLDDGTFTPNTVNLHEVDYIESENRRLVYYVGQKKYYQITKLQEMQSLLNEKDGFVSLDRINLVNLKKVKEYDENLGVVYFNHINEEERRRYTTVARLKQKFFSPLLQRAVAKNMDKQITNSLSSKPRQKILRHQEFD